MQANKKLENLIKKIADEKQRPSLLLHVCCGPCSTYVLEYLSKYFKICLYFYNPNIDSLEEYQKRAEEVTKVLDNLNLEYEIVSEAYHPEEYYKAIKGLENEKEGGKRCWKCFYLRLDKAARYAQAKSFDYFTTTLSISPYKNANLLNKIGDQLEDKYHVSYLAADFKKKDGHKRSIQMSKEMDLYRQDYCGCIYSKEARNER